MVTITDIARRLGVAVGTVSMEGLNGANDVSESTRALILKTAVEMGLRRPKGAKIRRAEGLRFSGREEFLSAGQFAMIWPWVSELRPPKTAGKPLRRSFQGLLSSQEALDTFLLPP